MGGGTRPRWHTKLGLDLVATDKTVTYEDILSQLLGRVDAFGQLIRRASVGLLED